MKKLLAIVLALALTVLLFGCTSEQPAETDTEVPLSSEEVDSSLSTDSGTQESDLPSQTDSATQESDLPSQTDSDAAETESASDPVSTEENADLPADFSQIDLSVDVIYNENTLTFYHIRRDVFLEFLDKPSTAILTASEGEPVALGDRYNRGSALFLTDVGCVPQLSTPERASAYLKTRNIEKNVKHVFLFDVPGEPIFAWIVGEDCNYIVSFKFDYEIEETVAVLHTFEDFRQLHRAVSEKNCKLIVKGKDITSEAFVHLHEESGYVDLPITAIMEELGATVVWTDGIVTISLEDKTTTYDTTIPYFGMPLPPGGKYMARKVIAGDLVLDNIAVRSLLKAWTGMNIYVDMENKIVEIK